MPDYTATGGLNLGNSAHVASSAWAYTANGGLNLGNNFHAAKSIWEYSASGGLSVGSTSSEEVTLNFITTFTWDVSLGVLRNWRVEGDCQPVNQPCPPTYNSDAGCPGSNKMQFMMNVQAYSLTDLCNKLKTRNWIAPIKKVQVWSQPVNKSDWGTNVNPTCNTLTTVDITNVPECMNFLVNQELSTSIAVNSVVIFENDFAYVASGGLRSGNTSSFTSPQYYFYTASGGLFTDSISDDLGILSTSGSVNSTILDLNVRFGSDVAITLVPGTTQIQATCCTELQLPQLLFVKHDLNRSDNLSNFLKVNSLTLPPILSIMFNNLRNSWYTNIQLKGLSVDHIENQVWNIIFEFGCLTENAILGIPSDVWGFSSLIRRRGVTTGKLDVTRLALEFNTDLICTAPGALKFDFTFNTRLLTTVPSVVKTAVFLDELNSFKGVSYRSNPNASFEVSVATPSLGSGMFNQSVPLQNILVGV